MNRMPLLAKLATFCFVLTILSGCRSNSEQETVPTNRVELGPFALNAPLQSQETVTQKTDSNATNSPQQSQKNPNSKNETKVYLSPKYPPVDKSVLASGAVFYDSLGLVLKSFKDLPGWEKDELGDSIPPLKQVCKRLLPRKNSEIIPKPPHANFVMGTVGDWRPSCEVVMTLNESDHDSVRRFYEAYFVPFGTHGDMSETGLFTGYYEAELNGSLVKSDKYRYPLYSRPPDLVSVEIGEYRPDLSGVRIAGKVKEGELKPYENRKQIESGALANRNLELVYVDSAIDLFFLSVQGSGRINLEDGTVMKVGYAGANGHPYMSIGGILKDKGIMKLEDISMGSIRNWLELNPEAAIDLLNANPSYVFFKVIKNSPSPIGGAGLPLTAGRTIAIDRNYLAYGLPLWINLEPGISNAPTEQSQIQRLVITLDTGGAIIGPMRGDIFWGYGDEAQDIAGHMRRIGQYFVLLPKMVVKNYGKQ